MLLVVSRGRGLHGPQDHFPLQPILAALFAGGGDVVAGDRLALVKEPGQPIHRQVRLPSGERLLQPGQNPIVFGTAFAAPGPLALHCLVGKMQEETDRFWSPRSGPPGGIR